MRKSEKKPPRKPWTAPRARRLESGSAEFGPANGSDGSGFS
jgi:hypothetical protein